MGWPGLAAVSRGMTYWGIPMTADEEQGLAAFGFFLGLVDGPDGSIRLASTAPDAAPLIHHGYAALLDGDAFDNVWADFQRLLETDVYRSVGARDVEAGRPLRDRLHDRISTGTHPSGGCAIGRVVDPELQVYGVDGLTVADASVFPRHVTNNPNLTCHMVGEVASAKLRGGTAAAAVAEAGLA
jgi:choline dehydrogenase